MRPVLPIYSSCRNYGDHSPYKFLKIARYTEVVVEAVGASFESMKSSSLPMGASPASARTAAPRAVADSADVVSADLSASSMGLPAAGPAHPLVAGFGGAGGLPAPP